MTGQDYEYAAAGYLRRHGYSHVRVTRSSGDYGVDVTCRRRGRRYAVQCKYYTRPVGISAVQQAVAGKARYDCDGAMVITNSTLTRPAMELAESNEVIVLQGVQPSPIPHGLLRVLRALLWLLWLAALGYTGLNAYAAAGLTPDGCWTLPLIIAMLPLVMLLLMIPLRAIAWRAMLWRSMHREARLRRLEQQDEDDLIRCREIAMQERAALPPEAFQPAVRRPSHRRVLLFFPGSTLMKCVLAAVGDRPRFTRRQLARAGRLTPQAAGTLIDCLLRTGMLVCDKPSRYSWSRFACERKG